MFKFWVEAREGTGFNEVKEKMKKRFEKYLKAYEENKIVVDLLKSKYVHVFREEEQETIHRSQ